LQKPSPSAKRCNLAAGSGATAGSLFADTFYTFKGNSVLKFAGSGGAQADVVDPGVDDLVATDPTTGHLYVASNTGTVSEYDASGSSPTLLSSFEPGQIVGLAISPTDGRIFVDDNSTTVRVYSPLVAVPDVTTGATAITGDTSVKVEGIVNPDGVALEECSFEYGETGIPPYEHSEPCAEGLGEIGTSTKTVHLDLAGLAPETLYHYRLRAKNKNAVITGSDRTFQTPAKPVVSSWASDVGTIEATLKATVNPENAESTYYIEWGPELPYAHRTATVVVAAGRDTDTHTVGLSLEQLQPGTSYNYRIVASNNIGVTEGADHVLRTFAAPGEVETGCVNEAFRSGSSAALPDCRAYEMVTPLDKNNGDILTRLNITGYPTNLDQSAASGSGFTYSSYRAFSKPGSAPYTDQYLAFRDPEAGWSSESVNPARSGQFRLELENEYQAFSSELDDGWMLQEGEPTLDSCAPAGFTDLYRRQSADGTYHALSCVKPTLVGTSEYRPELQGFSTDGSHAVLRIDDKLTPNASSATTGQPAVPVYQVYETTGTNTLSLVSILPNGETSNLNSSAGRSSSSDIANHNRLNSIRHAVSDDGTRVFWSTGIGGSGPLYLRTNADQAQSKIVAGKCSQPSKACTIDVSGTVTPGGGRFQVGSPDGVKALFTVRSGPLANSLYEFDSSSEPAASNLIATGVAGNIVGASEDLSRVYFASEEASAGEQAEGAIPGKPNVYLAEAGTVRFVATLSTGAGVSDLDNQYGSPVGEPINHTSRVSPDGASVAFMSTSLALSEKTAGYDNTDAVSGRPDGEVYLYDVRADNGTGRLRCVSCNPSGARPLGIELEEGNNGAVGIWSAARVPVPTTELYQSRYLSDDGTRVFFDSYDALALGDTNGKEDVYEWEAAGSDGCTIESNSYAPVSEGCVSLISSGRSLGDSEFLDASTSGSDVFLTTVESLLPQDSGLIDVYDARVDGGVPPPVAVAAGCEGEACQSAPVTPLDLTPASFAFSGSGSPAAAVARPKAGVRHGRPCAKGKTRKKGRCVKVRRSAKKGSVRRRQVRKSAHRRTGSSREVGR
jgi:hypothetical protein